MERLKLKINIDKDSKRLLIVDLFLLFSIISTGIIFTFLKEYIDVQTSVAVGLIIGLIAMFYLVRSYNKWRKRKNNES